MDNALAERQLAIQLRLAGETIEAICQCLRHPRSWFMQWWQRYHAEGAEGLYELSRAPHTLIDRLPPQLERLIVSVRRRLEAHATPETRYPHIGAPTVQAERQALPVKPWPSLRTIERIWAQHGLTSPRRRTAAPWSPTGYPAPTADDSNPLHPVDLGGPVHLKGQHKRGSLYVCKDVFDGAIYAQ